MTTASAPRRRFLQLGCATLAAIPLVVATGGAQGATNANMRASLKYQAKPEGDKSCATCNLFVPGAGGKGTCKVIPGDDEIAANAYCIAWAKKG